LLTIRNRVRLKLLSSFEYQKFRSKQKIDIGKFYAFYHIRVLAGSCSICAITNKYIFFKSKIRFFFFKEEKTFIGGENFHLWGKIGRYMKFIFTKNSLVSFLDRIYDKFIIIIYFFLNIISIAITTRFKMNKYLK